MPPEVCNQHSGLMGKVDYICEKVTEVKLCLLGDMAKGETGAIADIKDNTDFRHKVENRNTSLVTFAYRTVIGIVILYIAAKVGVK